MTELKTLKEICEYAFVQKGKTEKEIINQIKNGRKPDIITIDAEKLKLEVIWWIKELNKNRSSNPDYSKEELNGINKWIKLFFNIHEDDLK